MPADIMLALLALYLMKVMLFWIGARRALVRPSGHREPSVTVIVAARNEERMIDRCLDGLAALEYPPEKLEILVIDDQSTDRTREILDSRSAQIPGLRVLSARGTVHGLFGKANAVAQAIEHATGEIIFTTDADCVVPAKWIRETMAQFSDDVGCVCGFTLIEPDSPLAGMQSVDWAYLMTIASAGVGWGIPLSAVGNNMAFRRRAYDEVGGYAGVGFSVTEDFALFKAIGYATKWKIRYPASTGTLVWSAPCDTVRDIYRQKKRWGRGGIDIHPAGFGIMSIGFLMSVALLIGLPLGAGFPAWGLCAAGKCVGDALLLSFSLRKFGRLRFYRYFPLFELYYIVYVTVLPFIVFLTGKVVWKDRKL